VLLCSLLLKTSFKTIESSLLILGVLAFKALASGPVKKFLICLAFIERERFLLDRTACLQRVGNIFFELYLELSPSLSDAIDLH
jgi:hypothetical protein